MVYHFILWHGSSSPTLAYQRCDSYSLPRTPTCIDIETLIPFCHPQYWICVSKLWNLEPCMKIGSEDYPQLASYQIFCESLSTRLVLSFYDNFYLRNTLLHANGTCISLTGTRMEMCILVTGWRASAVGLADWRRHLGRVPSTLELGRMTKDMAMEFMKTRWSEGQNLLYTVFLRLDAALE